MSDANGQNGGNGAASGAGDANAAANGAMGGGAGDNAGALAAGGNGGAGDNSGGRGGDGAAAGQRGQNASGAEGWYIGLPGADKLSPEARQFIEGKNPPDFASLVETAASFERMARGRHVLDKPADGSALRDWSGWEQLGWQSDRDAYVQANFKRADLGDSERETYSEPMETALLDALHSEKVPGHAVQGVYDKLMGHMREVTQNATAEGQARIAELEAANRKEWGAEYDRMGEYAKAGFAASGLDVQDVAALEKFLGSAPAVMNLMAKIGKANGESDFFAAAGAGGGGRMTAQSAQAKMNQKKQDRDFTAALKDPRHPGHADAQEEWDRLNAAIAGVQ